MVPPARRNVSYIKRAIGKINLRVGLFDLQARRIKKLLTNFRVLLKDVPLDINKLCLICASKSKGSDSIDLRMMICCDCPNKTGLSGHQFSPVQHESIRY